MTTVRFRGQAALTQTNPVALVDRPPATRQHARRIRFLQPVEVEALLRAVPEDELGTTEFVAFSSVSLELPALPVAHIAERRLAVVTQDVVAARRGGLPGGWWPREPCRRVKL